MDFSLFYFANDSSDEGGRYKILLDGARFADANGFTAVWTPERHFHPFGGIYPNPSVTGAAIAAITEHVAIRAGSVVAPLHHPLRIAEEWAVVDNLSGGRVGISFASGWHATDFALRPENYHDRRQILSEYVQSVRRLWRGEALAVTNGVGEPIEVRAYPAPVQRELPVWVTSAGSVETFREAGRLGAGVLTHLLGQDTDALGAKIAEYRKAITNRPDADGRPGHVVLMIHTYLDEDENAVREIVRGPLTEYLGSSLSLMMGSQLDGRRKVELSAQDTAFLAQQAFERYFEHSLLGTAAKASALVERYRAIGVDEVACLIDFGLPADAALSGLTTLAEVHRTVRAGGA
jgi:natural product biosynthesis luciferase-like monooxygenase protein